MAQIVNFSVTVIIKASVTQCQEHVCVGTDLLGQGVSTSQSLTYLTLNLMMIRGEGSFFIQER